MTWLTNLNQFSKAEDPNPFSSVNFLFEELRETERALVAAEFASGALINVVDGFADSAFVSLSGLRKTLLEIEIPSKVDIGSIMTIPEDKVEAVMVGIMDIVTEANLAKVGPDGEFLRDENGKITKPKGWTPPEEKMMSLIQKNATKVEKKVA